jgi:hypothetical protein
MGLIDKWRKLMGRTPKDIKADSLEADMASADAALEERLKFDIMRVRSEEVGGCDACGGVIEGERFVLCVKAGYPRSQNLLFCEYHEGELLKRLLRNYLRRVKGNETVGFCGPLPKDIIPGEPISDPPVQADPSTT